MRRTLLLTGAITLAAATAASAAPTTPVQIGSAPGLRLTLSEPWTMSKVRPAGDVNLDGRTDLLISLYRPGSQAAVVVFGGRRTSPVNLNAIGQDGYYILNVANVVPGDDVNGDGRPDLFETNVLANGTSFQAVIYGKSTTSTIDRRTLTSAQGAVYDPTRPAPDPWNEDRVGDFNGDGIRDEIRPGSDAFHVAFGTATAPPSAAGPGFLIRYNGVNTPCKRSPTDPGDVSVLGDVTGDGKDDIGISGTYARTSEPRQHKACVVKGRSATTDVDLSRLAATGNGFTVFLGEGRLVSTVGPFALGAGRIRGAGDIDGNGVADFAVETLPEARYVQHGLYVFPGGPRSADIDATRAGTPHLRLTTTQTLDEIVALPDATGDGRGELAIGVKPVEAPPYRASTPTYIVSGRPLTGIVSLDALGSTAIKVLPTLNTIRQPSSDLFNWRAVQKVGDIDADGKTDLAIYEATPAGPSQVETLHVLYGALR